MTNQSPASDTLPYTSTLRRSTFQWHAETPGAGDEEGGASSTPDFWSVVKEAGREIPPCRFAILMHGGYTYRVSRIGDGGLIAVEVERPGMIYLVTSDEALKEG